jgi:O-acetyl-ADP-ribose deacetylase (regulator of RNase III)
VEASAIRVTRGDITRENVDVIVNAANSSLRRGAGVCGAIFAAAGRDLDAACAALAPCATGDAKITPGFGVPAHWIVHTVGPVWHGGDSGEDQLLASCYRRSLALADEVGAHSIAFPAISTGIYGFPKAEAARVAIDTLEHAPTSVSEARLVAFDAETEELYNELLGR